MATLDRANGTVAESPDPPPDPHNIDNGAPTPPPPSADPEPRGGVTGPHPVAAPPLLRRNWLGVALLGSVLVAGGLMAIAMPAAAGIAAAEVLGAALLVVGALQTWQAFGSRGLPTQVWYGLSAGLCLVVGWMLMLEPLIGTVVLSLLLVALLVVDGLARIMIGLTSRPSAGWGAVTASGALSVVLGGIVWLVALPTSTMTLLGALVGVALLFEGVAFIYLALAIRPREDRTVMPS